MPQEVSRRYSGIWRPIT